MLFAMLLPASHIIPPEGRLESNMTGTGDIWGRVLAPLEPGDTRATKVPSGPPKLLGVMSDYEVERADPPHRKHEWGRGAAVACQDGAG